MFRLSASMRLAMRWSRLVHELGVAPDEPSDEIECHDDDDQGERRPPHPIESVVVDGLPGERSVCADIRYLSIDHARKRRLVSVTEQVSVDVVRVADQDQDWRSLTGDSGDAEHDAGDDACQRRRHGDAGHRLPLRNAECVRRLAELVRHELEHLLGSANDDRNHQEHQGQRREPAAALAVEGRDEHGVDEYCSDDGRHPAEDVDHERRRTGEWPATVLDEVDAHHHRDRDGDQRAQRHLLQGAENRVPRAATRIAICACADRLGEPPVAGDRVPALADHRPQQPDQWDQRDAEGQRNEHRGELVLRLPGGVARRQDGRCDGAHVNSFPRLTTLRAAALTANVSTNSTRPAAMNAPVCFGSLNSAALFAIFDANVSPPLKIEKVNGAPGEGLDRMSMTAIVSPSARPRPSIEPLMRPGRPYGSTATRIISQRVAPSAHAASMFCGGVRSNTSRLMAVMIGRIMMASTTPPSKIVPTSTFLSLKSGNPPRWYSVRCTDRRCGASTMMPQMP